MNFFKSLFFSQSQKIIIFLSLSTTVFFNITFFKKIYIYALNEENYLILFSSPFILFLIFISIFNLLFLFINKCAFKLITILIIIISILSSYFIDTFGTIVDKNMFYNIIQTDKNEAFDYITFKLMLYIFISLLISYFFIFKYKTNFNTFFKEFFNKLIVFLLSFIILTCFYMILSKSYSSFFRNHHELRMYINPYYPVSSFFKFLYEKNKPVPVFKEIGNDAKRVSNDKKKLIVFILGETARSNNFSLNNYNRNTNPLLNKRDDIVSFKNFYSCGTATAVSVPCIFSKFGKENWNEDKKYFENVIDVLNKTGINVIWIDNNSGGAKDVNKRNKNNINIENEKYDEVLLENLNKKIDTNYEDTFIVLHQEGSHGPTYFKRYPDKYKHFTPTCDTQDLEKCTQEQIINTYNNTIVYTDYIINETIEIIKTYENKYETTVIYVSDHGESLGENGIYLHGLPYLVAPENQKHIPAIFYTSNKNKLNNIKLKTNDNLSHDNLFHTILGLFNVETKEYIKNLDIF